MPQVGHERCLFCALCEEVCPPKCLTLTKNYDYEAYDKRDLVTRPEELE
jgi:formate hydrogenlyase subunit 6/NADH:ubiquinone oxidoreductase subunit I